MRWSRSLPSRSRPGERAHLPKHQEGVPTRERHPVLDHRGVITEDDLVDITVTVERGCDPVQGTARLPGGEERGFWGWMELVTIVQEVLEAGQGVRGGSRILTASDRAAQSGDAPGTQSSGGGPDATGPRLRQAL